MGYYALIYGAVGMLAGSALHIIVLIGGPEWIKFVGAPESVIQSARDGTLWAPVGAIGIALLLAGMALFALSGAGVVRSLPFLKTVTAIISMVFIVRGVMYIPYFLHIKWNSIFILFHVSVSMFILTLGIAYAIGLWSLIKKML